MRRWALLVLAGCVLASCAEKAKQAPMEGRLSIAGPSYLEQANKQVKNVNSVTLSKIHLAQPVNVTNRFSLYENAANYRNHVSGSSNPTFVRKVSISDSLDSDSLSLAAPVVFEGNVYLLDSDFTLRMMDLKTQKVKKYLSLPTIRGTSAKSVGLALSRQGTLYAVAGNGVVVAVSLVEKKVLWQKDLNDSLRSAPTVFQDKLIVSSIKNNLYVLNEVDGSLSWQHKGMPAVTNFFGMGAPAVGDSMVIMPTTTGYLQAFDLKTGVMIWTNAVWSHRKNNLFLDLPHIVAAPVIHDGRVYAVGNAGKLAGYSLKTGRPVLEADVGGHETITISGNAIFMISNQQDLVALNRQTGSVYWSKKLVSREDEKAVWYGPVLTENRLVVTSSQGDLILYDALTGREIQRENKDPFLMAPLFANGYMMLLTSNGDLLLYQ